jgi:hypothetical protein
LVGISYLTLILTPEVKSTLIAESYQEHHEQDVKFATLMLRKRTSGTGYHGQLSVVAPENLVVTDSSVPNPQQALQLKIKCKVEEIGKRAVE